MEFDVDGGKKEMRNNGRTRTRKMRRKGREQARGVGRR